MRTTIRINDELLQEAKRLAARTGETLTAIIEDALRESLSRQREATPRKPVRLVAVDGHGPLPGVDLDDSAAVLDLMESFHGPA